MNQKKRNRLIKLSKIIIKMLNKLSYLKFVSFQKKKKKLEIQGLISSFIIIIEQLVSFWILFQTRDEDSIPETNLSFPAKLLFVCTRLLVSVVNPLTGRGRRVDAPRRVRSPQSRRSSKGATNNFLPLKTFTQPELNSSKLAASKVSILDKCSSVVYMLCIVRNGWRTLFRYRKHFVRQKNRKKEKDEKKITTKSRLTFSRKRISFTR